MKLQLHLPEQWANHWEFVNSDAFTTVVAALAITGIVFLFVVL